MTKKNKDNATFQAEAPAGPGNENHPEGAKNPPADSNPDVVAAKAKVNPQAVGAVLAESEGAKAVDPLSDEADSTMKTAVESSSTDAYMRDHAPIANQNEEPLRNADVDEDTDASVPKDVTDDRVLPDDAIDDNK